MPSSVSVRIEVESEDGGFASAENKSVRFDGDTNDDDLAIAIGHAILGVQHDICHRGDFFKTLAEVVEEIYWARTPDG